MSVYSPKTKAAPKTPPSSGSATPDHRTRPSTAIGAAMTPEQIQAEASRRAMNETGLTTAQRKAFAARVEADLLAEASQAEQAKAAAAIAAEATAERQRIGAVIKTGADMGRPRQAARLAISSPLDAIGAKSVLATLPTDDKAAPEALALPAQAGVFGSSAAQAERRRIGAILGHPEAADRFATASALALDTSLDLGQALAALTSAPKSEARKYPTLAERSAAAGSFGPLAGGADPMSRSERIDNVWKKAVREANAAIGATPTPVASTTPVNPSLSGGLDLPGAETLAEAVKGGQQ